MTEAVQTRSITLLVTGMTCANCAATIERNVRKLAGVSLANVSEGRWYVGKIGKEVVTAP